MKKTHYIAMAGLKGYLPNYCQAHNTRKEAVDDLCEMHELTLPRIKELRKYGYVDLNIHKHGNEYAEVTECSCDNPEQHNDN